MRILRIQEWAKTLKSNIYALYLAYKDQRTPVSAKICILVIVAYAVSPIDFIPDFIPVFGYLDDIILLPLAIWFTLKLIPKDVWSQCKFQANDNSPELPQYKIMPAIIVMIWCLLAWSLFTLIGA